MEPDVAPDFIPVEFIEQYAAEARRTIHARVTPPKRGPSAETLELWRACLIGLTGAIVLFTAGFGILYLTMVARGLVDIVVVAGLVLAVLWTVYLAASWRAANRYRTRRG